MIGFRSQLEGLSFMELFEAIRSRYSVRSFRPEPVGDEVLDRVLEAARLAPSANNRQPWKFVVVRDRETRERLAEIARGQRFVAEAPVVIAAVAVTTDHIMTCGIPSYPVDLAIAVDHITLAAAAEGLGTCWIGAFYQQPARELLGIPDRYQIVALLPLGYPLRGPGSKRRKGLDEIVSYEKFTE